MNDQPLSLYLRTQYWGDVVNGFATKSLFRDYGISVPTVSIQAVMDNHNAFSGCCFNGKRCIELYEDHFVHHYAGCWNLYMLSSRNNQPGSSSNQYFRFCLLPEYIACHAQLVGKVHPAEIRLHLSSQLGHFLLANRAFGYPRNHVHIVAYMEKVWAVEQRFNPFVIIPVSTSFEEETYEEAKAGGRIEEKEAEESHIVVE